MVLLFYPSDFTYVEPTELLAFDAAADVFAKLETEAWHCSHCDSAKSSRLLPQFSTVSFVLCDAYCTLTTIALRVVAASTHAVGMCFRPFVSLSCVHEQRRQSGKRTKQSFAKPSQTCASVHRQTPLREPINSASLHCILPQLTGSILLCSP